MGFGINDTARDWTTLANRWGTHGGNAIRGILNFALPVTVLERFRDENEGGVFGLTAFTGGFGLTVGPGQTAEHPAVCITNPTQTTEILSVNISFNRFKPTILNGSFNYTERIHMYTPFAPYNACVNNTLGAFVPGLIARSPFGFGQTFALSGTNPALPAQPEGFFLCVSGTRANEFVGRREGDVQIKKYLTASTPSGENISGDDFKLQNTWSVPFDPPIRVPPNNVLVFQRLWEVTAAQTLVESPNLDVSILFTNAPNRRG